MSLKVTPGATVSDTTQVDAALLNQLARPTVEIPAGSLTPDQMQISALLTALLTAGGDSLRGRSLLAKGNFGYEDWESASVEVTAGTAVETASGWTLAPAGGPVTAARAQDGPDTLSTWGAQLTGGTGVTSLDFHTFVPSGIAGSLRETTLTLSVWIKNLYSATALVQGFISPASSINSTTVVTEADSGAVQTFPAGVWTRLVWTFPTNGMDGLENGFRIGIRTASLNSPLKSLLIAQAQLEASTVAGPWMRPAGSGDQSLQRLPLISQEELAMGAHLLVQLASGALRRLPNPLSPESYLGFNAAIGAPRWANADYIILVYSGSEEIITIPPEVEEIEIHAWGAGGGDMLGYPGGCGGYTWGRLPVTPGQEYTAVVGQAGGSGAPPPAFGFGGPAAAGGMSGGGGLTGLFTGTAPVTPTDTARARLIAGGGGGVNAYGVVLGTSDPTIAGGNGNDPASSGGGGGTFAGVPAISGYSMGGGGGYVGGGLVSNAGRGGTGYLHTDTTAGELEYTARSTPVTAGQQLTVPGNTVPYYQDGAGRPGTPGLMIIIWNPPA